MATASTNRVAIYARVSTDNKGQDPENQLLQLRAWCNRIGYVVVREYVDHESGAKGADQRKQFGRLFTDAARRDFDMVHFTGPGDMRAFFGCSGDDASIELVGQSASIPVPYDAAGSLDDGEQRKLLAAKLDQIEDKRRQLGQMADFLRAKLEDLEP